MKVFFGYLVLLESVLGQSTCLNEKIVNQMVSAETIEQLLQYGLSLRSLQDVVTECPITAVIDEISYVIVAIHNDQKLIQSTDSLSKKIVKTRIFLSDFENFKSVLSEKAGLVLVRLLGLLSTVVKRAAGSLPAFKSGCTVAHRYKSSAIAAIEKNWDNLAIPNSVFPIASRVRDLSISKTRCLEDSLVSVVSAARSYYQLNGDDLEKMKYLIWQLLVEQISVEKSLGVKQPVFKAIESLVLVLTGALERPVALVSESLKKERSKAPVFGFDCESNQHCEVEQVLKAIATVDVGSVNKSLRREHMFLQSINANWWPELRKGYGFRIASVLADLSERLPKKSPKQICQDKDFVAFVTDVIAGNVRKEAMLAEGLRSVIETDEECTVEIAASFALIQLSLTSGTEDGVVGADFASGVMEMVWQTVAGDKLDAVLANSLRLFDIMKLTWSHF